MNDVLIYLLVAITGLFLGIFFFGGLWWTTRKGVSSKYPVIWFLGSIVIRLGVTILVLYYVSQHHWERMLICLAGFIIARYIVLRFTKAFDLKKVESKGGGS